MSDALSNREIEDVLTSIRRLVAQEGLRPAASDRLILTEAQRVVPGPGADVPAVSAHGTGAAARVPEDGVADARTDPAAPTSDVSLPEPDFGQLEATIAELEAAVTASGESWDGDEPVAQTVPRASNVTDLYGRIGFKHREAPQAESGAEGAREESQGRGAAHDSGMAKAAIDAPAVEPVAGGAGISVDRSDPEAEIEAPGDAEEAAADLAGAEDAVIDEDMLRALVAQIVREELHGQLGERITHQVRKLVRAEIARALDERNFL
ncbi:MAG: hypothetical protein Kow0013_06410 [Pararhodobacter sp.]